MKRKDENLIIRYWSGELTKQEEVRVLEILNSEADGEEATQILADLQFQQDLLNAERTTPLQAFSEGDLLEKSLKQWEKESKVAFFRLGWIAPTIGVAATLAVVALVLKDKPIKQNQIITSNTDDLLGTPTVTDLPEVDGMYAIDRKVSELELAIADAATNRRFSRYNSTPENN